LAQPIISAAGTIESTTGGFKFPDGSIQLSAAAATSDGCTAITSLPLNISSGGVYCFIGSLSTSGDGITIAADNVTINMNGWTLDGSGAGIATTRFGIFADQKKNITIRNGTIHGFQTAILLQDFSLTISSGHLIEDIRADNNTYIGFWVMGNGNIMRRNQVVNTGGSTNMGFTSAYGIVSYGFGGRLISNDIIGTSASSTGSHSVYLFDSDGSVIEGNRIDDATSDTGSAYGVYISSSDHVLVVGNRLTSAQFGVLYDTSTGKFRDNLTSNVGTAFTGGTDALGND